jgi:SAM-dependent methyltransferase
MSFTDATTRFSTKAEVYAKARPRYPLTLVRWLEAQGLLRPGMVVADIGSGTGLSAEPFLQAGYEIIGIEPNQPMRSEGDRYLSQFPHFRSQPGTAEATSQPATSVDFAFAAQAFHWFDLERTRAEMHRILRSPAPFLAMWNHRNHGASELHREYEALLLETCPEYHTLTKLYRSPERSAAFFPHGYQNATLPNPQQLTEELFEARVLSASYIPKPGTPELARFLERMRALFHRYARGGVVTFDLELWLHVGHLK